MTSLITHDGRPTEEGLRILHSVEGRGNFDSVIGRLDRVLSEFLELFQPGIDLPDRAMLKKLGIPNG
jgi:hypothetical protein